MYPIINDLFFNFTVLMMYVLLSHQKLLMDDMTVSVVWFLLVRLFPVKREQDFIKGGRTLKIIFSSAQDLW